MSASTQYKLSAADLETVLSLVRSGTLADAGELLGVDASTVFRSSQRIERGLGQALFERLRAGYQASELAQSLAEHGEQLEAALESARSAAQLQPDEVSGTVRITTTDTILHGLVAPALKDLRAVHPLLGFELHTGNELASLTRRDADIAVRATKRPPQHLVGKHVGPIRVALFAAKKGAIKRYADVEAGKAAWVAPDDALPEHPSVAWRKRHFPKVVPSYRVNSILTVMELVGLGLGVGVVPLFLAKSHPNLVPLTEVLDECQTELWLLTPPRVTASAPGVDGVWAPLAGAFDGLILGGTLGPLLVSWRRSKPPVKKTRSSPMAGFPDRPLPGGPDRTTAIWRVDQ